jgi:polyisoprenyl-teichoic acid--peptidoglycan teichoic acid transferase
MEHQNFRNLNLPHSRRRKKFNKKLKLILFAIAAIVLVSFLWSFMRTTSSVFNYSFGGVFQPDPFKGTDGRLNILLLGNAGGRHDGAELTDSIIVASYHLKSNQVTLISIPRDLWVDSTKSKINAVYEYGELPKNGSNGIKFAKEHIDNVVGFPIHYAVRLDFNGFARAIDHVEGVEIDIPKTFDDFRYPIEGKENDMCGFKEKEVELPDDEVAKLASSSAYIKPLPQKANELKKYQVLVDEADKIASGAADFDCRYEHLHFTKGKSQMDGETALKFVRSRMGTNGEGSDFARSRRQQLVIQSFREKALSIKTLTNPKTVLELIGTLGRSIETDIPLEKYLDFYNLAKKVEGVKSIVLGDLGGGKSILIVPPAKDYGGAFVLTPPNDDFTPVREYIKKSLDDQVASASATAKQ